MYYHRESQRSKSDEITYLPELYSFVISRQKKESTIRHMAPPDLVDLLLNLQTLQIIKLNEVDEGIRILLEAAKGGTKSR